MKIDDFKEFVKRNPVLIESVKNNDMTWQKFYEMYDLYGEDNNVWSNYLKKEDKEVKNDKKSSNFSDIINMAKQIDADKIQNGITSLQKVLGLAGDLFLKKDGSVTSSYQPRPVYKRFED